MFINFFIKSNSTTRRVRRWAVFLGAVAGVVIVVVMQFSPNRTDVLFAKPAENPVPLEVAYQPSLKIPKHTGTAPAPDNLTAKSILVKDHVSGAILFGKDPYVERPLASITKLMSALLVLEHGPIADALLTVVDDNVEDPHVISGLEYGEPDLWQAALVGSSNKSILTLADSVGWGRTAFIERMNQKALELGMADSVFVDPTGLDDGNLATASDVAILLREAMEKKEISDMVRIKEMDIAPKNSKNKHHIWNTDWLILDWIPNGDLTVLGGKTGFIPNAGYNFAVEVEDVSHHILDVVVLGSDTNEARFTDARDIAKWVFENFTWPE